MFIGECTPADSGFVETVLLNLCHSPSRKVDITVTSRPEPPNARHLPQRASNREPMVNQIL